MVDLKQEGIGKRALDFELSGVGRNSGVSDIRKAIAEKEVFTPRYLSLLLLSLLRTLRGFLVESAEPPSNPQPRLTDAVTQIILPSRKATL
jgi:hypothetical protein